MDIQIRYNYKDIYYLGDLLPPDLSLIPSNINHSYQLQQLVQQPDSNCLFTLRAAAHYTVGSGHVTTRQDRPDYQLLLTTGGQASVLYNHNHYILTPGSAMLVDCRKWHRYQTVDENSWEYKHIHFCTDHPQLLLNAIPTYTADFHQASLYFDEMTAFSTTAEAITAAAPYIYSNYISNILTSLIKSNYTIPADENQRQFLEVVQYIHQHFNEPLSLGDMAKVFHYSESYFIRLFKKHYNSTPYQYLIRYRLARVREMLWNGDTIQKAALSCGFNSTSAFYHALKTNPDALKGNLLFPEDSPT